MSTLREDIVDRLRRHSLMAREAAIIRIVNGLLEDIERKNLSLLTIEHSLRYESEHMDGDTLGVLAGFIELLNIEINGTGRYDADGIKEDLDYEAINQEVE